jgi:hypothetical protein
MRFGQMEAKIIVEDEELENWLLQKSAKYNLDVPTFIIGVLKKHKADQTKKPQKVSAPQDKVDALIEFFKSQYQDRFTVPTDEKPDKEVIQKIWTKLVRILKDEDTTFEVLQKAIIWYLYVNKNEGADGQKYPYLMRLLFEQEWLRRQCIEASSNFDIATIKKIIANNMDPKDIAKSLKRGDYSGAFDHNDITQEWEATAKMATKLFMEKKLTRDMKNDPIIKNLFQTEIPSIEYIRKAKHYLEEVAHE